MSDQKSFLWPRDDAPDGDADPSSLIPSAALTDPAASDTGFVKLEKNLASLGFFTPASKNTKKPVAKTIQFTRLVGGKRVLSSVSIAPSVLGALPTTADQDKYLAFQKILLDRRRAGEEIVNPVSFSTAELLRVLDERVDSGKNHHDVARWLQVMTATTIVSQDAVFFAGRRAWVSDTFHVFDRVVSAGRELPDGTIADRNYVWLSEWQRHNLNHHFLLPIDFDAYKALRNHIAKALVPLLQIWLYASEGSGVFEKRYDELCQHLQISRYRYPSKIREKLGPALDELVQHGYLTAWDLIQVAGDDYKVIFAHGAKYFDDKARRPYRPAAAPRLPRALPPPPAKSPGKAGERPQTATALPTPKSTPGSSAGLPEAKNSLPQRPASSPSLHVPTTEPAGDRSAEADAEAVCRYFHQQLYRTGTTARLLPAELREAAEIVRRYGAAQGRHLTDYFLREVAPRTRFRPDTICGLRPHLARALADYDASRHGQPPPKPTSGAAVAHLRQRHIEAFQTHYDAFRKKTLTQLQDAQPDAFREFLEREDAERAQAGAGTVAALRAITLRHFDRERTRLDRAWRFFAGHPEWGILTFWEWDSLHNPQRFTDPDSSEAGSL